MGLLGKKVERGPCSGLLATCGGVGPWVSRRLERAGHAFLGLRKLLNNDNCHSKSNPLPPHPHLPDSGTVSGKILIHCHKRRRQWEVTKGALPLDSDSC